MNKAEFITLIDNPQNLDKSHITALKNIAVDFPYFQANHILLSKALFNENHYEFEKQLKSTALLVSNRELLYRFLHNLNIEAPVEEIAIIHLPEIEEKITELVSDIFIEEEVEEKIIEEVIIESIEEAIIPIKNETQEIIVEPIIEPEIIQHQNETFSFTEWLLLSSGSIKEQMEQNDIVEQIEVEQEQIIEEVPIVHELKIDEQIPKTNIHQFESILDKFIRENPSISRPKAEFYKPAQVAKQSGEEDDDLVTETLANIYYQQGAYKKAIRAYEKLCLIYPHKLTYFATLIQKIKDEIKND